MNVRRAEGMKFEERAAAFLIARGYELVERNFTSRYGEIDLICRDGDTLVFVEVKMRPGHPGMAPPRRRSAGQSNAG